MRASTGAGKGDQYRPVNKVRFDAGYERACGRDCPTCRRRGYIYDDECKKEVCPICKGTGIQN